GLLGERLRLWANGGKVELPKNEYRRLRYEVMKAARWSTWGEERRGGFTLLSGDDPKAYDHLALRTLPPPQIVHAAQVAHHLGCPDLAIDPEQLQAFSDGVRLARQAADHAAVGVLPQRPPHFCDASPEGRRRHEVALARVQKETGVPVINLDTTDFVTAD